MKLLELNHVEKSFGDLSVIKDISMSVEEGEIVSIIGPSGSGKSTLLRCATMLETMDSGEVVYLGKKAAFTGPDGKVVYAPRKELKEIQAQYGLVFQNFNLFPHYSVLKNIIDAPIHVQKRKSEEVIREAYDLLRKMGLEDKAEAYPCQLSGGQCQRLVIARALLRSDSAVYIFDEAASNIDVESEELIMNVIHELAKTKTVLLISHRLANVVQSDQIYFLKNGTICERGTHAELMEQNGAYRHLYDSQMVLENYGKEGNA